MLTFRLAFIRAEGINIVLQLDVKDTEALPYAYSVITQFANAAGVPAIGVEACSNLC